MNTTMPKKPSAVAAVDGSMMKKLNSKAKPGDVFYIPSCDADDRVGFNLARYVGKVDPNIGFLIEVFSKFYTELPVSLDEVDMSDRLFRPIICSFRFSDIPYWKIVFNETGYDRSDSDFDSIEFAFDTKLWRGGLITHLPPVSENVEPATCWRMHHIVFRVMAHLAGVLAPNDKFDYHRLPSKLRVDNAEGKALVAKICSDIDEKFSR